jgi:hypothetical protein
MADIVVNDADLIADQRAQAVRSCHHLFSDRLCRHPLLSCRYSFIV